MLHKKSMINGSNKTPKNVRIAVFVLKELAVATLSPAKIAVRVSVGSVAAKPCIINANMVARYGEMATDVVDAEDKKYLIV